MDNFDTLNHNVGAFNAAVTHGFWDVAFAHPLLYLGYAFAFAAALAFLVFLRGFLSGLPHIFTLSGNDEYMPNHRRRAIWGTTMLLYLFILWEIVRWILDGIFGLFGA